MQPKIYHPDWL